MTTVILLGASTRSAAMSARRAGWTPWCADLFADADLERTATVSKVASERYPHGLLDALAEAPAGPVMYTGALENRPALIARIDRPLWGNSAEVLRAVRDPLRWTDALKEAGLSCPTVAFARPSGGRWLVKPRRSAAGIGIVPYDGGEVPRGTFLQEQLDGDAVSGLFLGSGDCAIFLGATRQLIGTSWLNTDRFHYAGNIGPLPADMAHWQRIGAALTQRFGLLGLFGVDAIERDGIPWPVEINPRYTASVEIFERALGISLLATHRACFEQVSIAPPLKVSRHVVGKAILYARGDFAFPPAGPWLAALEPGIDLDAVEYADIPHAGQVIEARHPVLTIFAHAESVEACAAGIREKAEALDRRLWG